ncbi:hypothetical protein X963_6198 [Burkholderia pseudomallei MSHR7498]|nr:hypothetical protein BBK_1354 [Burkholderia pseudomallei NCTC 13179]KGS96478.1 hypothetical protein X963_6198 [Burkholderia pseudomallei MSHR7498]KGU72329.1 hypothetical protein X883_535 [Burkholderia pseudomallei MSHR4304]KGV30428.1 hypothetical protein X884_5004 [Burkholderia pseudomallei MSHR4308]KGW15733.1 hypothetical protein X882_6002 [Burkholderia pseudomallei MSHR4303]KGW50152.1 hypothetical protein Y049_2078 [Burkholderia pseudomallei MSHR684]KGW82062.1 hypothetical protein Y048_9
MLRISYHYFAFFIIITRHMLNNQLILSNRSFFIPSNRDMSDFMRVGQAHAFPVQANETPQQGPNQPTPMGVDPPTLAPQLSGLRVLPRPPSPTHGNGPSGRPRLQATLPTDVEAKLLAADNDLHGAHFMAGTATLWLSTNGIPNRLGGSLGARMHGASRQPQDIDIEVRNSQDLDRAMHLMSSLNTIVENNGRRMQVRSEATSHHPGLSGVVKLHFTNESGLTTSISVDITNENNPLFNHNLVSPEQRGVKGGVVSAPELIINYLDRSLKKQWTSQLKDDDQQIIDLLRNVGFDPSNTRHVAELKGIVETHVAVDARGQYLHRLEQVINNELQRQSSFASDDEMDVD